MSDYHELTPFCSICNKRIKAHHFISCGSCMAHTIYNYNVAKRNLLAQTEMLRCKCENLLDGPSGSIHHERRLKAEKWSTGYQVKALRSHAESMEQSINEAKKNIIDRKQAIQSRRAALESFKQVIQQSHSNVAKRIPCAKNSFDEINQELETTKHILISELFSVYQVNTPASLNAIRLSHVSFVDESCTIPYQGQSSTSTSSPWSLASRVYRPPWEKIRGSSSSVPTQESLKLTSIPHTIGGVPFLLPGAEQEEDFPLTMMNVKYTIDLITRLCKSLSCYMDILIPYYPTFCYDQTQSEASLILQAALPWLLANDWMPAFLPISIPQDIQPRVQLSGSNSPTHFVRQGVNTLTHMTSSKLIHQLSNLSNAHTQTSEPKELVEQALMRSTRGIKGLSYDLCFILWVLKHPVSLGPNDTIPDLLTHIYNLIQSPLPIELQKLPYYPPKEFIKQYASLLDCASNYGEWSVTKTEEDFDWDVI